MTNEELILQKLAEMNQSITELDKRLSQRIDDSTALINLKIENDVTRRLESLFDGYKLTHEKQWELDRKINELEKRLEKLEMKAS